MKAAENKMIRVETTIDAPVERVWKYWTEPQHIIKWNYASDDWHSPTAENDLRVGGKFKARMEAKDKSNGFDFSGEYNKVENLSRIEYHMDDGRNVVIEFIDENERTKIIESFEPENEFSLEMQEQGWQAILDNFKKYSESLSQKVDLHFEITIHANIAKVYNTMLHPVNYQKWTSVFSPDSRFEGSWDKGSIIKFLGTPEDEGTSGMFSKVLENLPYEHVVLQHLGVIINGEEISSGPKVDGWAGAKEEYRFKEKGNDTQLLIDLDTLKEYEGYMLEAWPKALQTLKDLCEKSNN
jgi:uncharacterized protein YndB with AHSA1/START domain